MRHPGQVLSSQQILSAVWGYDFDPGTNVVEVYVGYLRRKLALSGQPRADRDAALGRLSPRTTVPEAAARPRGLRARG